MMQLLDPATRACIKEKASCIGFCFGNNQIEYSFKQVWIPIRNGAQQIWLVIEVVPKSTPFLLSIQTMRRLGAVLDLQQGTCFLQTLGKAIPLKQGTTGLLMISLADLCQKPTKATFVASPTEEPAASVVSRVVDQPEPKFSPSHADPSGSHGNDQGDGRCSHATAETPIDHAHESGPDTGGSDCRSVSAERTCLTAATPDAGSSVPEDNVAGDREQPEDIRNSFHLRDSSIDGMGRHRGKRNSSLGGRNDDERNGQGANANESNSSQVGTSTCKSDNTKDSKFSQSAWSKWSPIPSDRSTHVEWTHSGPRRSSPIRRRGDGDRVQCPTRQRSCMDPGCYDILGTQSHQLGKEASWQDVLSSVRIRRPVHELVFKPPEQPRNASARLCQVQSSTDLSTFQGQMELLRTIIRSRPKHVWVAPECAPWCAWNRFNAKRGIQAFETIQSMQSLSREHLKLCAFICKIQIEGGRHFTMENPGASGAWSQPETKNIVRLTKGVEFDQCQFGLRHPQSQNPMKKATRLQTKSREIVRNMDGRTCNGEHVHHPIAGSCQFKGKTFALSRFAAFYPYMLARKAAKGILFENQHPDCPIIDASTAIEMSCPVREAVDPPEDEPEAKKKRVEGPSEDPGTRKRELEPYEPYTVLSGQPWTDVMNRLQSLLPKSGAQSIDLETWPGNFLVQHCQIQKVQEIKAIKGVEKFMIGNHAYPHRQTISLCRKTQRIMDLGVEEWTKMPQTQQRRKAIPSHIMISIFGENPNELDEDQAKSEPVPRSNQAAKPKSQSSLGEKISPPIRAEASGETPSSENKGEVSQTKAAESLAPIPTWMPVSTINSGPKFLELNSKQQSMIRKMHNNLGHPVSERLSEHLSRLGFTEQMIEGAKDYQCQSCAERVPPKLTTPGKLKEPREFNERLALDGFEWKGEKGNKYYVLHFFDEATHFHLGRRCQRTAESTIKTMTETWTHWAGSPQEIQHDEAGEFMSQPWKDFLQQEGIRSLVSAAPWQRGRIERHGGVIKEMLSRIDKEQPITNEKQFDMALSQCFQAKNSLTIVKGYSPEQAVLGKSRRLPASICGDEEFTAHSIDQPKDTRSEDFLQKMEIRTLARKALLDADNSQAIRRALNHQSRGQEHPWRCGELCMIWDKRKSPNMLEKGRWTGPCQIVMEESRTIVWVTQMNRLLRVAKENIRPVSIREFNRVATFHQSCEETKLQAMAEQLKKQLKERSGMFQFSDLTEVEPPQQQAENSGPQPEEEPHRRDSEADIPTIEPASVNARAK